MFNYCIQFIKLKSFKYLTEISGRIIKTEIQWKVRRIILVEINYKNFHRLMSNEII